MLRQEDDLMNYRKKVKRVVAAVAAVALLPLVLNQTKVI